MIVVHLVTRPRFSASNSDWPILTVGSAALIFRRDNVDGQIVLAGSGGQLHEVANSVPLDGDAFSREPLDVLLAYDPASGIGVVGIGKALNSFQSAGSVSLDVMLSAGTHEPWKIDSLEVQAPDQSHGNQDTNISSADVPVPTPSAESLESTKISAALQRFLGQQNLLSVPPALLNAMTAPAKKAKHSPPELEIFTPPSVRFLSATAMRALVERAVKK
jgi:hypothetical protein